MGYLVNVAIALIALIVAIRVYLKSTWKRFTEDVELQGKTVVVTGANAEPPPPIEGIGKALAGEFAARNARVILACRSLIRAEEARQEILATKAGKHAQVEVMTLDLSSLESVRKFADEILRKEERLDILVNNAAIGNCPVTVTTDNLELTYQTNHFVHFLLTNMLLDLMKTSGPESRVVNVGSDSNCYADLNLDYLAPDQVTHYINTMQKSFRKKPAKTLLYFNSKLMNLMFTFELARRLGNCGVTVNCVRPGFVRTNLMASVKGFRARLIICSLLVFSMSVDEGCQGVLHCAISKSLDGISGKFFSNCEDNRKVHSMALDIAECRKLWKLSEEITGLKAEQLAVSERQ